MAEKGYLVLSDITGYTQFLTESELDHAQGILRELLNALIEHTRPPLIISKLEGDAIFSYASETNFVNGQTLIETIEKLYVEFRQALRRMKLNTTCTCTACSNIPKLDLKFFVHHGEYAFQQLGTFTELVGTDVNLVHRMMKNKVTESHGFIAYGMYSGQALTALSLDARKQNMTPHQETYDHIGDVDVFLEDMHAFWESSQDKQRIIVTEEDAVFVVSADYPYPPEFVWEFFTNPEYRAMIWASEAVVTSGIVDGQILTGTTFHCFHGEVNIDHVVVDWQPFDYYTFESPGPSGDSSGVNTLRFERLPDGSTRCYGLIGPISKADGSVDPDEVKMLKGMMAQWPGLDLARKLIEEAVNSGDMTPALAVPPDNAAVESAVEASLGALGPGL